MKSPKNKGFTIIELIVVIAIIAVLAGIVMTNVSRYINKSKEARAIADAQNISKALSLFYVQYGDYPWGYYNDSTWIQFSSSNAGGEGEPFLTVNSTNHYLSEFYKSDWNGYNANYIADNGFFYIYLWDNDGDGKIGCGQINIYSDSWSLWHGYEYLLCTDCPDSCVETGYPFKTTPY